MGDRKVTVNVSDDGKRGCIGGGHAYAAHGVDVVLLAFTPEVGWWRNSVGFTPDEARAVAADLLLQADYSESLSASEALDV